MILNDENFEQEVVKEEALVVVDFFAPWCGPCKMMGPVIEELIEEYKGKNVKIGKYDVDENTVYSEKYNIMSIPTIVFFKKGQIIKELQGYQHKEGMNELIDANI